MSLRDALEILLEDNHLLALNKPAGWPSAHFDGVNETLDRVARAYLKEKYQKPGNVYLGVVHRLDKPVTGVLLFARTSKAAARLSEQFREGVVEKTYWAVVADGPPAPAGTLTDWLVKREPEGWVEVVPEGTPTAQLATLHSERRAVMDGLALIELRPQTGRRHQLRVQLAARGWPIYGDHKYGSKHAFGPAIGLHARSLTVLHPTQPDPVTLTAELPRAWRGRFARLLSDV